MNKLTYILAYIIVLLPVCVSAKTIKGRVLDESSEAMEFVSVAAFSLPDSILIGASMTDDNGMFMIGDNNSAHAFVRVSYVGYEDCAVSVPESGEIGDVMMVPSNVMLDEVTVKAYRSTLRKNSEGRTTSVENTSLSEAGNAEDVLRKVPSVIIENGEISVFGKDSPQIFIDGRAVRDNAELSRLSSNDIKDIEVIANPGVAYSSSVTSVIRIRTKKRETNGLGGQIRSEESFNGHISTHNNLDLAYTAGNFGIFTNIGYVYEPISTRTVTQMSDIGNNPMQQLITINNHNTNNNWVGKIGMTFSPSEFHSLGAYYQNGKISNKTDYTLHSTIDGDHFNDADGDIRYRKYPCHNANIFYSGKLSNVTLDLNIDYIGHKGANAQASTEAYINGISDVQTNTCLRNKLFAQKFTIGYNVGKVRMSIGDEYTYTSSKSNFHTNINNLNDAATSVLEENIAAFCEVGYSIRNYNLSAGFRYEHIKSKHLESGERIDNLTRNLNNTFPTFSISGNIGKTHTVLSFNRKRIRPAYESLDGTIVYVNSLTLQSGNPQLKSSTVTNVEALVNWKWLTAGVRYTDIINPVVDNIIPYGDGTMKLLTKDNAGRLHNYEAFAGGVVHVGAWHPKCDVGITMQKFSQLQEGHNMSMNRPIFLVKWQNVMTLPRDVELSCDVEYISGGDMRNIRYGSASSLNIRITKHLFDKRLRLSMEVRDLFDRSVRDTRLYSESVTLSQHFKRTSSRILSIGISYQFNTQPFRYKGSGAGSREKARLGLE